MKDIVLFTVNTGCRNNEICQLHWSWEYYIDTLNTSAFIIPGVYTKNGEPKLIVLNDIAKKVVNKPKAIDISVTRESLGTHLESFGKKFFRYVE